MDLFPDIFASGLIYFYKLLYQIGPFFLFIALVLGIVGLPIPDELLLIGSGYLVAHQKLNLIPTLAAAIFGSICGITISYFLGRLIGFFLIKRYGKRLNITEEKVETAKSWFSSIGKWILMIGYFIPLFRHVIGFVAGVMKLPFQYFALYAYSGAIIWSVGFFSLGFFFFNWFTGLFGKSV